MFLNALFRWKPVSTNSCLHMRVLDCELMEKKRQRRRETDLEPTERKRETETQRETWSVKPLTLSTVSLLWSVTYKPSFITYFELWPFPWDVGILFKSMQQSLQLGVGWGLLYGRLHFLTHETNMGKNSDFLRSKGLDLNDSLDNSVNCL